MGTAGPLSPLASQRGQMEELQVEGGGPSPNAAVESDQGKRPDVVLRPHHACACAPPIHTAKQTNKIKHIYDKEKEREAPEKK